MHFFSLKSFLPVMKYTITMKDNEGLKRNFYVLTIFIILNEILCSNKYFFLKIFFKDFQLFFFRTEVFYISQKNSEITNSVSLGFQLFLSNKPSLKMKIYLNANIIRTHQRSLKVTKGHILFENSIELFLRFFLLNSISLKLYMNSNMLKKNFFS